MRDWIEERFNITLTPKDYNWGNMETKINTWAASATLPDVFFMAHIGTGRYFPMDRGRRRPRAAGGPFGLARP